MASQIQMYCLFSTPQETTLGTLVQEVNIHGGKNFTSRIIVLTDNLSRDTVLSICILFCQELIDNSNYQCRPVIFQQSSGYSQVLSVKTSLRRSGVDWLQSVSYCSAVVVVNEFGFDDIWNYKHLGKCYWAQLTASAYLTI